MNETETQSPENSSPGSEREEQALAPAPAEKPETELEATEQPPLQSDRTPRDDLRLELVKPESLADGDLPEPSEHVIREHVPGHAESPKPEAPAGKESGQNVRLPDGIEQTDKGLRDNSGRYFDPEKHQHSNGIPKASDKGYFRPWGRVHRKAGLHVKAEGFGSQTDEAPEREESFFAKAKSFLFGEPEPETQSQAVKEHAPREAAQQGAPQGPQFPNGGLIGLPQPSQDSQSANQTAAMAAAQLVAMEEMLAVMVFSEKWQFLSEERRGLIMAWTRALEEKGIVETPWWMELGAAHAVIFANRTDKPKTREKLGKMKASIMKKVIDFRTTKAPAQVDMRKEAE